MQTRLFKGDNSGLDFITPIKKVKRCQNKCIFCFIDQMPKGLRKSLYFKDDDYRLSFLHGNYITLNNLLDKDIEEIIRFKISPLYVSLHSLIPEIRRALFGVKDDPGLAFFRKLASKIDMHIQIVLCTGLNDGQSLIKTLKELTKMPKIKSIGIVPVGLSKHRQGLKDIRPWTKELAAKLINSINYPKTYLADEFFLLAEKPLPLASYYDNYPQAENGIGIARQFLDGVNSKKLRNKLSEYIIVTGQLASPIISSCLNTKVVSIKNHFLGTSITVAGLVAGRDIANQLKKESGIMLLPDIMLNEDNLFIDDWSLGKLRKSLPNLEIIVVPSKGELFVDTTISGFSGQAKCR
ncbi:MAG: DUF512 domain-containing protein [Actinobacteria bacterium]|nr:MAG: DUF512 domain-containing protein [Actinomycetota bacterium]